MTVYRCALFDRKPGISAEHCRRHWIAVHARRRSRACRLPLRWRPRFLFGDALLAPVAVHLIEEIKIV